MTPMQLAAGLQTLLTSVNAMTLSNDMESVSCFGNAVRIRFTNGDSFIIRVEQLPLRRMFDDE